ncbi:4-hydroxy-tetrahydrodipicolinate synthase [Planosporangium mesophilum]|nr:4-hydroxy-tetrahydrodipicolinate synthase [Planosporangium mesophilum]
MRHILTGVHVPLVTPFAADGRVAGDALERLAYEVIDAGAAGVVALGTTGEPATLNADERRTVIDICARVCRERRAGLMIGAGSNDTAASVEALRGLNAWPEATAALTVVPYYSRPSERGVIAHFTRLAADSPVPLVIYHVPYRTGQAVGAGTLRHLVRLPGVIGIKYATGGIDADTVALMADRPAGFAVLAGDDAFVSPMLALGAAGGVLASAHLCTAAFVDLVHAWHSGDVDRARDLGHRLVALSAAAFAEPNPTVVKAVLHAQGRIPTPAVRLPLLPASAAATEAALAALASVDLGQVGRRQVARISKVGNPAAPDRQPDSPPNHLD